MFLELMSIGNSDAIITYSAQFFELMSALDARAQVIVARQSTEIEDSQFRFDSVTRSPFQNRREYFASERAYGDQVVEKLMNSTLTS